MGAAFTCAALAAAGLDVDAAVLALVGTSAAGFGAGFAGAAFLAAGLAVGLVFPAGLSAGVLDELSLVIVTPYR